MPKDGRSLIFIAIDFSVAKISINSTTENAAIKGCLASRSEARLRCIYTSSCLAFQPVKGRGCSQLRVHLYSLIFT